MARFFWFTFIGYFVGVVIGAGLGGPHDWAFGLAMLIVMAVLFVGAIIFSIIDSNPK